MKQPCMRTMMSLRGKLGCESCKWAILYDFGAELNSVIYTDGEEFECTKKKTDDRSYNCYNEIGWPEWEYDGKTK